MRNPLAPTLAAVAFGLATAAGAELIEYRLSDGRTGYTNDRAQVPPGAQILSAREESPSPPPEAAPPPRLGAAPPAAPAPSPVPEWMRRDPEAEAAAAEAMWRRRAQQAARAVEEARIQVEGVERIYSDCRGRENYWNWRWGHRGIDSSCQDEGARLESARGRLADAEAYLADGLFEDCRRAGCLPGWVR
jgi:hypothetical protein